MKRACSSRSLASFFTHLRYKAITSTIACLDLVLGCFMLHFGSIVGVSCVLEVPVHKSCPFRLLEVFGAIKIGP